MAIAGPRSILCVHPNEELYGSDRVLLQTVRAFRARWPDAAITARLPGDNRPLADELRRLGAAVEADDLFVLRRSRLVALPAQLLRLRRRIAAARGAMDGYELVYLSTVVLLDFLLASRARRGATLIHVHELPGRRSRPLFSALLRLACGRVVFISDAVRRAFGFAPTAARVVWNGTRDRALEPPSVDSNAPLRVLMIGRFNAWKGQGTLLAALALIPAERRRSLAVRIVGSVYGGQERFARAIEDAIAAHGLRDVVETCPFIADPNAHYRWADVVTVPSTSPEPFGLVAIEAMAAARPVIASAHGGLAEIVVDECTGLLVPPADPVALAAALMRYADDRVLLRRHGEAGRRRFEDEFDERIYLQRIADVAADALDRAG